MDKNKNIKKGYANSSFFKMKDEKAKEFLKKHPIPDTFWD